MGRATMYPGTFDYLLANGAKYVVAFQVQGLVTFFPEANPLRSNAETTMALPAGHELACPGLLFDDGSAFTLELDRETGFARGDAVDVVVAWEALEELGLTTTLFKVPALRARLVGELGSDVDAVEASVDSTAGWVPGQRAYIGRETMTIGSIPNDNTFEGLVRNGLKYNYRANSPSAFGNITDTPEIWAQRDVTVHVHLLSPEGRALDTTWFEGAFHKIVWRGFLEKQPKESEFGMKLRALPLCRMPAKQIGYELGVKVVTPDVESAWSFADQPIVVTRDSNITVHGEYTGGGGGTFTYTVPNQDTDPYGSTIAAWARLVQTALDNELSAEPWYTAGLFVDVSGLQTGMNSDNQRATLPGSLMIKIPYNAGGGYNVTTLSLMVHEGAGTYWLSPNNREGKKGLNNEPNWHFTEGWPGIVLSYPAGSWLPVVQTSGEGYADLTVPDTGVAMLEVDGAKELIAWDEVLPGASGQENVRLLHITQRGVDATAIVDMGAGAELKFVSGHVGTPKEVLLTLLQSSGTGTRGTYDTLGIGQGYGIPAEFIDEASFNRIELMEESVAIYSDGRTSLEDLMGGWLALQGLCLTQRRFDDGGYRLTLVRTDPALPATTADLDVTLLPSDVEMGGIGQPDTVENPTEVRVARSGIARDLPTVIPQDVPAIQAMGLVTKDFSAPGMSELVSRDAANSRIAKGLGQSAVAMRVMPWLSLQGGDIVRDRTRHPGSYDWTTGTRAPAEIAARVVGTRWTPRDGRASATMLRAGLMRDGLFLCPGTTVRYHLGTAFGTDVKGPPVYQGNDNGLFAPSSGGIKATLYNPGNDSTQRATVEIVGEGDGDWVLTTGTLPAWVEDDVTRMTFAELGTNDALLEPAHMFVSATRRWGA